MNHLAVSYNDIGRRQEAMELSEKTMEACQRTLGSEHPDTLRAMTLANLTRKKVQEIKNSRDVSRQTAHP